MRKSKSHVKVEERNAIAYTAINLRKQGLKYHEITKELKNRGFLRRDGTEISVGAIHGIINKYSNLKAHVLTPPKVTTVTSTESVDKKLQALGAVLKSDIKDKLLIAEWILKAE